MRRRLVSMLGMLGMLGTLVTGCGGGRPATPPITVPELGATVTGVPAGSAQRGVDTAANTPDAAVPAVPAVPLVTPTPTAAPPPPLRNTGLADVSMPGSVLGHLGAVRLARQENYDRLVLEFTDQVPGYTVGYRPLPATADGSGAQIPLPGATEMVQVTLTPASAHREDTAAPTYTGPATVRGNAVQVTEAKAAGDFEGHVTWVAGVRAKVPFRVLVLANPPRLVVDFVH